MRVRASVPGVLGFVLATSLLLAGCSDVAPSATPGTADPSTTDSPQPDAAAPTDTTTAAPALAGLAISTGDLVPAFDPEILDYTTTSLNALSAIEVTARAADGLALTIHGAAAISGTPASFTLTPREDIAVTVASTSGPQRTYVVHYLPVGLPAYEVTKAAGAGSELVMLTPLLTWLLIVDRDGAPLYYRTPLQNGATVTDLRPQTFADGAHGYSYAVADDAIHVLDDHFRETAQLLLTPNRDHGSLAPDVHDFLVLGDQHYLLLAYAQKTRDLSGFDPAWSAQAIVTAAVVQEVDHGQVLFEWDSSDHPSLYSDSTYYNAFTDSAASDYVHANSLQIDPVDGNILVSLRHTSSILKLQRTTGATLWTLGGKSDDFGLTAEQRPSFQHHARKQDDGTLLVFDNGWPTHATRIVSYALDESTHTVLAVKDIYTRPDAWPDTTFMGSVFRMDADRHLIGWGGRSNTAATWPAVTEIAAGVTVWTLTFEDPKTFSYRAHPTQN